MPKNKLTKKIKELIQKYKHSMTNNGERVDINHNKEKTFENFDIYQKSHYKRYEYAKKLLNNNDIVADLACGTGYGTVMLSEKAKQIFGGDIDKKVIKTIKKRYRDYKKVIFLKFNILNIEYKNYFDKIVSFETIEHLEEQNILNIFKIFFKALKYNGEIIFSVPYMQEKSDNAIQMGFHKTFYINEEKIEEWLNQASFELKYYRYQNYKTHTIEKNIVEKDFIICIAKKI